MTTESRAGGWIQTATGRKFWPIDPRPDEISIVDVAHALSMMCRFNGHCNRFYSVAEHSVLVSRSVPDEDAMWGLLHDASEAYIADIARPVKPHLANYYEIEAGIMGAVAVRFNLKGDMPPSVKRADNAILRDEGEVLIGDISEWTLVGPEKLGVEIECWQPAKARVQFLNRFFELTGGPTDLSVI